MFNFTNKMLWNASFHSFHNFFLPFIMNGIDEHSIYSKKKKKFKEKYSSAILMWNEWDQIYSIIFSISFLYISFIYILPNSFYVYRLKPKNNDFGYDYTLCCNNIWISSHNWIFKLMIWIFRPNKIFFLS